MKMAKEELLINMKDGFNKTIRTVHDIQNIKEKYFDRLFLVSCTIFSFSSQDEYIKTIKYINVFFKQSYRKFKNAREACALRVKNTETQY